MRVTACASAMLLSCCSAESCLARAVSVLDASPSCTQGQGENKALAARLRLDEIPVGGMLTAADGGDSGADSIRLGEPKVTAQTERCADSRALLKDRFWKSLRS